MEQNRTEDFRLPDKWNEWEVCEKLGEGTFGQVYRVKNKTGDCAAVKVSVMPDQSEVQAFLRLAGCPYIVSVKDTCIQEEREGWYRSWILMEDLKSLEEFLHEGTLSEEDALQMMTDLCCGLERCEKEKILHRDIKPENILLTEDRRAKLGDFNSAGNREKEPENRKILGTFAYMAPEVYHGGMQDNRTDLYSVGMVFYRIMNRGREPFVSLDKQIVGYRDRENALQERMGGALLPLPADASEEFGRILRKACDFRAEKRYQNASQLRKALEKCRKHRRNRVLRYLEGWSPLKRGVIAAAAVLTAAAFGISVWQNSPILEGVDSENGFQYSLLQNGTLILEGEGVMAASIEPQEWEAYVPQIKKMVFHGAVTGIEDQFHICSSLEKVVFPKGLESIGNAAFFGCGNLKEIVFPDSLKEIGDSAFVDCRSLESISFPGHLETISRMAFYNCLNLEKIVFPESLRAIGEEAFSNTAWQETQRGAGDFLVVNDILLNYFGDAEELELPQQPEIRSIAEAAFCGNQTLRAVILPDTVEEIGTGAFRNCPALSEAVLPAGLKEIPEGLFQNCARLERLVIPDTVERIGNSALQGCAGLKEITLPSAVTSIGENAFLDTGWYEKKEKEGSFIILGEFLLKWQDDEETLAIPSDLGIRRVADAAISWKEKLTRAVIPEGIVSIGQNCFFFSRNLETIEFPESLTEFGYGAMAATRWMEERQPPEGGVPVLVNGVDVSY